jgi:hypothetical protein
MAPWVANAIALAALAAITLAGGLALLWRVGSWHLSPAASLTFDEGLRIGTEAPEVACLAMDGADLHISFGGETTFVVFGNQGCRPCGALLHAAMRHPATRSMRLVYLTDAGVEDLEPEILEAWSTYRYHDEESARESWRAPVSPYFFVVNDGGLIVEKGVASSAEHLDRLLHLRPGYKPRAANPREGARA